MITIMITIMIKIMITIMITIMIKISKNYLYLSKNPLNISMYESLSDVWESRVWFASKNLTPCRMHRNAFLIAQIIAK